MSSTLCRDRSAIEVLNEIALRHEISISSARRTWQIRAIIAAHRDDNSVAMHGLGYGPDWKGYIKRDVIDYLATAKLPYVVDKMATFYLVERQAGAEPGTLRAAE